MLRRFLAFYVPQAFLNGFKPDEVPTDGQLVKLQDYVDNEAKAQFISDTLSKILL